MTNYPMSIVLRQYLAKKIKYIKDNLKKLYMAGNTCKNVVRALKKVEHTWHKSS